jgi:hypothetical protein
MESLIQSVLLEITESPTTQVIVRHVPRFVGYANTLTLPGFEKRATVLRGLHELTMALKQADKISADLQTELDQFIDLTVPPMIEAILDVAAGRVELKMPTSVAEVAPKVNCLLGFLQGILRLAGKSKEAAVVADVSKTVQSLSEVKEAKEVKEEVKEAKEEVKEVKEEPKEVKEEPKEVKEEPKEVKEEVKEAKEETKEVALDTGVIVQAEAI